MSRMLHLLPVEAYTSQDWYDREMRDIFSKTWRYAGFMEDVSEPGQYITVQAGLNNIFVVMGRDRRLRAFHNICRHRGTQLIRAVGKTHKALTCPYHDWTYDLEGNLISVPEEQEEFKEAVKDLPFIEDEDGDLQPVSAFYDPANPVFNAMLPRSSFPPEANEDFDREEWYAMLRELGLIQKVNKEMFVNFTKEVAGGKLVNEEEARKKSQVIVIFK